MPITLPETSNGIGAMPFVWVAVDDEPSKREPADVYREECDRITQQCNCAYG
jgi:hypothetical protein